MRSLDNSPGGKEGLKLADVLADTKRETPLADIEKREMIQRILAALEKLEDHQRVIVVLRDIEGMSLSKLADVLQLETGTVKSRLSRARLALRELLQAVWI
jgi:RNA polymerase sigma-70 factor (ECF subfamily)